MIRAASGVFRSQPTPSGCWGVHALRRRPTSSPNSMRRPELSSPVAPGTEISLAASLSPISLDANPHSPLIARNSLDEMGGRSALQLWRPAVHLAAKQAPPWILAPRCRPSLSCAQAPALRLYFSWANQKPEKQRAACSIVIEQQI